jgi:predicted outer membrane protein
MINAMPLNVLIKANTALRDAAKLPFNASQSDVQNVAIRCINAHAELNAYLEHLTKQQKIEVGA